MNTPIAVPSSGWYHIVTIIVLVLLLALFVANAVYYRKLHNDDPEHHNVESTKWLFWLNVVAAVFVGIHFILAVFQLFKHSTAVEQARSWSSTHPNSNHVAYLAGEGPVYSTPNSKYSVPKSYSEGVPVARYNTEYTVTPVQPPVTLPGTVPVTAPQVSAVAAPAGIY